MFSINDFTDYFEWDQPVFLFKETKMWRQIVPLILQIFYIFSLYLLQKIVDSELQHPATYILLLFSSHFVSKNECLFDIDLQIGRFNFG